MACLFCRSTALEPLDEGIRDHYGVDAEFHRFLRCVDCGSATLDPLPSHERFGLTVFDGGLETLQLERGRYDAMVMVYVLEHIPDPADTLARIRDLLNPGGWAVLGLPVMDSGQGRWLGALERRPGRSGATAGTMFFCGRKPGGAHVP